MAEKAESIILSTGNDEDGVFVRAYNTHWNTFIVSQKNYYANYYPEHSRNIDLSELQRGDRVIFVRLHYKYFIENHLTMEQIRNSFIQERTKQDGR